MFFLTKMNFNSILNFVAIHCGYVLPKTFVLEPQIFNPLHAGDAYMSRSKFTACWALCDIILAHGTTNLLINTHDFCLNRVFVTVQSEIGVIAIDRVWQKRFERKPSIVSRAPKTSL